MVMHFNGRNEKIFKINFQIKLSALLVLPVRHNSQPIVPDQSTSLLPSRNTLIVP